MSRFAAITLDLSRFPAPLAIRGVDYEAIVAERLERLTVLLQAAGIEFDVASLESDPAVMLQEADASRELRAYAAINDSVRAGLVAFAIGSDLDHLGLTASLGLPSGHRESMLRRIIAPATDTTPVVMESDAEYRRRLLLAPEAYATAGTAGAYLFHALWADARVLNADVWSPAPGEVVVALQSRDGGGEASDALVEIVRAHLARPDIKPLTDVVTVRSVINIGYAVSLDAYILPGPDPLAVEAAIREAVLKVAAARRTPSRDMPRSAIVAAGQLDIVDKVTLLAPVADIAHGYGEVPVITGLEVRVHNHDG